MNNPSNDAEAAARAHAALEPGTTLGAAIDAGAGVAPAPEKKRAGRPKLPPGQKGKYKRRPKSERPAPAAGEGKPARASKAKPAKEPKEGAPKAQRGKNGGWLKIGGWGENRAEGGRTPTVLREKAREVLAELGYPALADIMADPAAKDADKLRAVDILMKASVGYMTPEQAMGEDAPELPPPIFNSTEGALPGDDQGVREESDAVATLEGESKGTPDGSDVIQFPKPMADTTQVPGGGGPVPYAGRM